MKGFKRRLAIVLAACMVITSVMPAFAEGESTEKPVLQEAAVTQDSDAEIATGSDEKTEAETPMEDTLIEDDLNGEESSDNVESSGIEEFAFIREASAGGMKVTVKADEGVFPEDAVLEVTEVTDAGTEEAIEEAVEKKRKEDATVTGSVKLDIKMYGSDGEEIQPDKEKGSFRIYFEMEEKLNDSVSVDVYHLKDDPETKEITNVEVLETKGDPETSEIEEVPEIAEIPEIPEIQEDEEETNTVVYVEPNGFSFYVIEFSYGWLSYSIDADTTVLLSKILEEFDISGTIIDASSSDADYLKVEKNGTGDWTVCAVNPDDNPFLCEWIYVDVDGGHYIIYVTLSGTDIPSYRSKKVPLAKHLYEVEYYEWNATKANAIAELISKANTTTTDGDNFDVNEEYLSDDAKELYRNLVDGGLWEDFKQGMLQALDTALCTSCRTGDLIGRNFDWTYDDVDEFVIRVPAAEGQHASIGVASAFFPTFLQALIGVDDIIPMLTMDGVNDQGVAINVNVVVGAKEVSGDTTGTNPDGENLCAGFVVRYILDNADSAEHAVELLKESNIFSVVTQEFHWMISDSKETYIVETVNNTLSVLQSKGKKAAMSNFHVSHSERCKDYNQVYGKNEEFYSHAAAYDIDNEIKYSFSDLYFLYPMGVERYNYVMENIDSVKSEEAMMNNMRKAWYLQGLYHEGNERFWSDHNFYPIPGPVEETPIHYAGKFTYYDDDSFRDARMKTFRDAIETYKEVKRHEEETGERISGAVQTVHTSVYNLKTKTLMVNVQERKTNLKFRLKDPAFTNLTTMYINGDNVGAADKCDQPGERWVYNKAFKTVILLDDGEYDIKTTGDCDITVVRKIIPGGGGRSSSGGGSSSGGPGSYGYSGFWQKDAQGFWIIKNSRNEIVKNAWVCDDAVAGNGKNVWYLIGADGRMVTAGLVQDKTGNFYSPETVHNNTYGMLRHKDGYYDCSGQQVYLQFSQKHDGSFGAVINPEGLEKLKAIYGVAKYDIGNENAVYTSTF